ENAAAPVVAMAVTQAPEPVAKPARAVTPEIVNAAAQEIQSYLESVGRTLDIRVDNDTGRMVVTVRDASTGDVIRQIPSEEALQLARSLSRGQSGLPVVFDQTA